MIAAQEILAAEIVDVAPDGLRRHREMAGELVDRDEAALAHQLQDLPLPVVLGHLGMLAGLGSESQNLPENECSDVNSA
jgi:hypothetical protein